MNMLTLLSFVTRKQPKNKRYPQNPTKSVATSNTTSGIHLSKEHLRTPISPNGQKYIFQLHQAPSGPVYTPEKHYKSFVFTRLFDLNMKIHSKAARQKRLLMLSRTNLQRYISSVHGFSTLAANNVYHSRFHHPGRE